MPPTRQRRIDKLPFDEKVIPLVAGLLGGAARLATFRLRDADVWQVDVPDPAQVTAVTLTMWPSIRRVDASSPALTIVFTDISAVELIEGVEVLFRRANGEYLIVAIGGKVIVRA